MNSQLLDAAVTLLVAVVTIAVPPFVAAAIKWFSAKTKIQITEADARNIQKIAHNAVFWAEEQSRKSLKLNASSSNGSVPHPATGDGKMLAAKDFMERQLKVYGIDADDEQIERLIEASLAAGRSFAN